MDPDASAPDLLAEGWEALQEAAFRIGAYDEAEELLRAALDRAGDDRATEAGILLRLGWLMHFRALDRGRDTAYAAEEDSLFQLALAVFRDIGDDAGMAGAMFGLGLVRQVLRRDSAAAIPYFREALSHAEHADLITRSEIHRHIGFHHVVGDVRLAEARRHLRISQELREEHGDPRWIPGGLVALGELELECRNRDEAVRLLREGVRKAREANLVDERVAMAEEALRKAEAAD
jgi:tetratricopeptide (TPR) repeat protein